MNSETTKPSAPLHAFVMHLEQLPGIDPQHTNHQLIESLFKCWESREQYGIHGGVTYHECGRGKGTTRTLIEWA